MRFSHQARPLADPEAATLIEGKLVRGDGDSILLEQIDGDLIQIDGQEDMYFLRTKVGRQVKMIATENSVLAVESADHALGFPTDIGRAIRAKHVPSRLRQLSLASAGIVVLTSLFATHFIPATETTESELGKAVREVLTAMTPGAATDHLWLSRSLLPVAACSFIVCAGSALWLSMVTASIALPFKIRYQTLLGHKLGIPGSGGGSVVKAGVLAALITLVPLWSGLSSTEPVDQAIFGRAQTLVSGASSYSGPPPKVFHSRDETWISFPVEGPTVATLTLRGISPEVANVSLKGVETGPIGNLCKSYVGKAAGDTSGSTVLVVLAPEPKAKKCGVHFSSILPDGVIEVASTVQ